jgi:bifunctional non-homologous end joining protein LigD
MLRRLIPVGFIEPCLPSPTKKPPSGPGWIHEIKHDGFRIMAHRDVRGVRLLTRNGNDFTERFPAIADAMGALKVKSCVIDGEAIVTNSDGLSVFSMLRRQNGEGVALCAFDLIKLNGEDLRKAPIEGRKAVLRGLLRDDPDGIIYNETFDGDGVVIYRHVCKLGCEGIVSKRLGSPYQSGRSQHWFKIKNPDAPAVRREAEIEWRKRS